MPEPASAPPNPYSNMAAMPGPLPPKKDPNVEELMKGFHGVFKALNKMGEMEEGLKPGIEAAKKALKESFAKILKGDPSTLDGDDSSAAATPPPDAAASNTATPPPDNGPAASNAA